jgi:ATP-dependent helicase/nuclease subunit B
VERVYSEIGGAVDLGLPDTPFTLSARADRIDLRNDGTLSIYDYKTGQVPTASQVANLLAPQLPLEAAIANAGGFEVLKEAGTAGLRYIRVTGRGQGGEQLEVSGADPGVLAADALEKLRELVSEYARDTTPYAAMRRPGFSSSSQYRYDEYAHLARIAEWSALEAET